ncbi:unnamed protein product [Paramecium octaurelia]|uniref:Uncharacterized protein n=1 Tax=Paramecium octaurelia TaxID=43137 RepID=A0A8S1UGG8_PAROT|nr:unnamed protein product [Paramecium octaurelia]
MHKFQCSASSNKNLIMEECFKGIQQEMELSFNRIDDFLDQIVVDNERSLNQKKLKCQKLRVVEQNESLHRLQLLHIDNSQFVNQLTNQVTSSIKNSIDNQIKVQSIEYQQLYESFQKQKIQKQQLNETIKIKDQQLQSHQLQIEQLKQTQAKELIVQQSPQQIQNQFQYEQLQNSIKQQEPCVAIATNSDCSIVVAGCKTEIKVFEFKQDILTQAQLLSEHTKGVCTLNFMKKSNQFISGSDDNLIIIWSMNQSNQWVCQQKLNEHTKGIYCLVLNNNEDLIISGSCDKTIKFWMNKNGWLCQQTITDHTGTIYGLSLNQQQNKVISCGYDKQILIIEQSQQDSQWIVIQKIKVETNGSRLCFINDNVFTFQPDSSEQMHVYEINDTNKQYLKTKDVLVKYSKDGYSLFPQQHIKSKWLLVNKNGIYVNLIKTNENQEFSIQQSIQFGSAYLFGHLSDDGQFLMTWDDISKEIQIRKYHEI